MAAKKIGAIIALDGEKSFKQSVTNCNKTLATLKSEMALVKAESDGQANSLENLQKKHEVLSEILEEQKHKQDEVQKALDHAKDSYDKVGKGIETLTKQQEDQIKKVDDLKAAYNRAKEELDQMKASGEDTGESMKDQEAVVQNLTDELKKEETALKDINDAISKGEQNYQTAANRIQDWESKLNKAKTEVIKANAEVNKNAAYMKEAQDSTDKCATSIDNFGREVKDATDLTIDFADVVKVNLGNTLVDTIKNAATEVVSSITSMETAQSDFQASTGASAEEMKEYNSVMSELNRNNYGEDLNDIADSMALVRQYTGELDPSKLEKMTENGIVMRDVFGIDLSETIRGVDTLVDTMGTTAKHAFDLMATGAQNGLDKSGELADNIAEYGQLWEQAGFSAEEMFTILQNGMDNGAYSLDKVNDFVKEFTISLSDGRIEENLGSFSDKTQELFNAWQEGEATAKDVFYSVISDLENATNKQEALTTASEVWSALGEDNAMTVITALNDVNDTYKDVQGTMEEIKEVKYDTLEDRFKQLGRTFVTEVGEPIAEKALPLMEEGLDFVIDNLDTIIGLMAGVGSAFAAYKIATTVQDAVTAVSSFRTATEGATIAQQFMNIVSSANPYVVLATAITGAATAMVALGIASQDTSIYYSELVEENQAVIEASQKTREEIETLNQSWDDSLEEIEAQEGLTEDLVTELYNLEGQSSRTSGEVARMEQIVEQLNTMYPDLNLSLDENAGKLNASEEATRKLTDASINMMKAEAAREQVKDIIEQQTEAELNLYKLRQEADKINEELIAAEDEYKNKTQEVTEGQYDLLTASQLQRAEMEQYGTKVSELNQQLKDNQEETEKAQESVNTLSEEYGYVNDYLNSLTGIEETTQDINDMGTAASNTAAQTDAAMEEITDQYYDALEKMSELVIGQMQMFEQFDASVDLSTSDLLNNMQSQIDGVSEWASNIQILADRGINQGLLKYLADMGPQGAGYVALFASMSESEFQEANKKWAEAMDLQTTVTQEIADATTGFSEAMKNASPQMAEDAKAAGNQAGEAVPEGFGQGVTDSMSQALDPVDEMTEQVKERAKTSLEINSPSKVFAGYGEMLPEGLAVGIRQKTSSANLAITDMVTYIQNTMVSSFSTATYSNIGYQIPAGIAHGIAAGQSLVISAVAVMCATAEATARNRLQIHSPSRVFETMGEYTAEGFGIGYEKKMADVRGLINRSMEFSGSRMGYGDAGVSGLSGLEKIVIELPIYTGNTYTKTEIVEIARNGLSNKQRNYYRSKGVMAGV